MQQTNTHSHMQSATDTDTGRERGIFEISLIPHVGQPPHYPTGHRPFPVSTTSGKTFIKMNLKIRKMQTEHKVGGKHFVKSGRGMCGGCVRNMFLHIFMPNPPRPSSHLNHHPIPYYIAIVLARLLTICIICIGFLIKNCAISLRFFALQLFLRLIFLLFFVYSSIFYYMHHPITHRPHPHPENHSTRGLVGC